MAGTPEGAQKARERNLANDPNFYSNIGKKSWENPQRSREVGFALMDEQTRKELGRKGGLKTKDDYNQTTQRPAQEEDYTTPEEFASIFNKDDTDAL